MKLSLISAVSASLFLASSTRAFVSRPATTFVGGVGASTRGDNACARLFAKGKAAKAAVSHEEDLDLTRKIILERMGMGPSKADEAPAPPSPAPAKKEAVEASSSKDE